MTEGNNAMLEVIDDDPNIAVRRRKSDLLVVVDVELC